MGIIPCFALLFGCTLRAAPNPTAGPETGHVITRSDIARTNARTAWDVLRRAGGITTWETASGGSVARKRGNGSITLSNAPVVVVDDVLTDLDALRTMRASHVLRMVILNGVQATFRYGSVAGNGAIVVATSMGEGLPQLP